MLIYDIIMPTAKFTEEQMTACLVEVEKNEGRSLRAIGGEFDLPESTVGMRLKRRNQVAAGVAPPKLGRPTIISPEEEAILAQCIGTLCRIGLSPTVDEIRIIVGEYINTNNIMSLFKDGIPERQWLERFFKSNKLTLKKATMISRERKDFTSNPFLVFDFYEQLSTIIDSNNLQPNQIWNMDETGFPLDPKKQMSVVPKGKRAYKTTQGSGRENITVLSVANAAGRVLDPLIINQGAYFLESSDPFFNRCHQEGNGQ